MPNRKNLLIVTCFLAVILSGCSTLHPTVKNSRTQFAPDALTFTKIVQSQIRRANGRDQSNFVVAGYPYLRTDRFLNAIKNRVTNDAEAADWLTAMRQLADESVIKEIQNLSMEDIQDINIKLNTDYTQQQLVDLQQQHFRTLFEIDRQVDAFVPDVIDSVKDRSQYSIWPRIYGFYPIFYIPTRSATIRAYDKFRAWHQKDFDDFDPIANMTVFDLAAANRLSRASVGRLYSQIQRDQLGTPRPTELQLDQLYQTFAPVIYQDLDQDFDRFGEIVWRNDMVTINTQRPVVYTYATYAFINDRPALQLNYSIWYTGRLGPNAPRLEKGDLDGLTIRITLDDSGYPAMIDTTNNCGCYHFYVPSGDKFRSIVDVPGLDALKVRTIPEGIPDEPLSVKINTGWHQIVRMSARRPQGPTQSYVLKDYAELESLPHGDGRYESVFDDDGIMKDSYRFEPFLFFPSGVSKVGYMRQRNNQPTKLIGHAHFSDPYLFDTNFVME